MPGGGSSSRRAAGWLAGEACADLPQCCATSALARCRPSISPSPLLFPCAGRQQPVGNSAVPAPAGGIPAGGGGAATDGALLPGLGRALPHGELADRDAGKAGGAGREGPAGLIGASRPGPGLASLPAGEATAAGCLLDGGGSSIAAPSATNRRTTAAMPTVHTSPPPPPPPHPRCTPSPPKTGSAAARRCLPCWR